MTHFLLSRSPGISSEIFGFIFLSVVSLAELSGWEARVMIALTFSLRTRLGHFLFSFSFSFRFCLNNDCSLRLAVGAFSSVWVFSIFEFWQLQLAEMEHPHFLVQDLSLVL